MVFEITADSAAEGYHEALWKMRALGAKEETRNGPAYTIQAPVVFTLKRPTDRVILCPVRDANPFFHVMETVWMFAGGRHVNWLQKFNKRIADYANDGIINGAYGWRWFEQWGDQPMRVIKMLQEDPQTRQAVIAMWDPTYDLHPHWKDRPCNTHIYFRVVRGKLNMTVCNRSNDLVWGMFGANIVHMTYLHEYVATSANLPLGDYTVFTNNLHFYTDVYPNGRAIWDNLVEGPISPTRNEPLVTPGDYRTFHLECKLFIDNKRDSIKNSWLLNVAKPIHDAYLSHTYEGAMSHLQLCEADDWRMACETWTSRHRVSTLCPTCD